MNKAPQRPRLNGPIFVVRLRGRAGARGADNIRDLRAILKVLVRWHRLRCIDVREEALDER
jgi:hypothetical protein